MFYSIIKVIFLNFLSYTVSICSSAKSDSISLECSELAVVVIVGTWACESLHQTCPVIIVIGWLLPLIHVWTWILVSSSTCASVLVLIVVLRHSLHERGITTSSSSILVRKLLFKTFVCLVWYIHRYHIISHDSPEHESPNGVSRCKAHYSLNPAEVYD